MKIISFLSQNVKKEVGGLKVNPIYLIVVFFLNTSFGLSYSLLLQIDPSVNNCRGSVVKKS